MGFGIVPESDWHLCDRIGADRKRRLLNTPFDQILSRTVAEAELDDYKPDPCKHAPNLRRALFEFRLPNEVVDLFHNGAGGYRAQYYIGVCEGENANRYTIDEMRGTLKKLLTMHHGPDCDWDFIEISLSDPWAKIWIHESAWFTDNKSDDRNLVVDRWKQNASKNTLWHRFEFSWAQLTPDNETGLDIKGGWIDESFASAPSANKLHRSQEIHDFGYT